ncbi:MAG: hypothetical protein HWN81_01980 [Candidatus Lokiarchaeota archaeon]|nr:hypothetical protein [Candidatus Lokiarchaeota archaeon]
MRKKNTRLVAKKEKPIIRKNQETGLYEAYLGEKIVCAETVERAIFDWWKKYGGGG